MSSDSETKKRSELNRNERATLLNVWPKGNWPKAIEMEILRRTELWHLFGAPGPLPPVAMLDIIAQFHKPSAEQREKPSKNKKDLQVA